MITAKSKHSTFDPALNMARTALYRFSAYTLLDPKAGAWHELHRMQQNPILGQAAALLRELHDTRASELGLGPGERPRHLLDVLPVLKHLPPSDDRLNEEYERAFGLLVSNACPPYETEYIDSKFAFQRSNTLADVNGFYRAFGLHPSRQRPERPDHIALELEFMACLLDLERRAAAGTSEHRNARLQVCREAQQRFLSDHLAWWAPAFAKLLGRESGAGFYAAAADFLAAFIPLERAILHVATTTRPAIPSKLDRPEECEGCELAS